MVVAAVVRFVCPFLRQKLPPVKSGVVELIALVMVLVRI